MDVIHGALCPYLTVYDLARLMQCNKRCFTTFIHDRAFDWIKQRILSHIPEWDEIFQRYPWKYGERTAALGKSKAKKRRKAWVMPRGGTWYVIKTLLSHLWSMDGLKNVSKYAYHLSRPMLLHGLRFAFDLPLHLIDRCEFDNYGRTSFFFKITFTFYDGRFICMAFYKREKRMHIGASETTMDVIRPNMMPYLTAVFEFDRLEALVMGKRKIPVYANVLKDFVGDE